MASTQDLTVGWARVGVVAGFLAVVSYTLVSVLSPPLGFSLILASVFGPSLAVASVGLYHLLRLESRTISLDLGVASNVVAGVAVTLMADTVGEDGSVLALMTGSPDTTYEAEAAPPSTTGGSDFRAIHGRVSDHVAVWRLASLRTPQLLTVQQVEEALVHLRRDAGRGTVARRSLSAGVSPGFLVAVAALLDEAIVGVRQGSEVSALRSVVYVFGSRTYELRVASAERTTTAYDGRALATVRTRFEIRAAETGARSRFELTAGTTEDLAGVPLTIEWQPHWWLRVKLRLIGPTDATAGL